MNEYTHVRVTEITRLESVSGSSEVPIKRNKSKYKESHYSVTVSINASVVFCRLTLKQDVSTHLAGLLAQPTSQSGNWHRL